MKLTHLTAAHISKIFEKANARNALSVVVSDGWYEDAPGVTDSDNQAAWLALLDVLNSLSDEVVVELQALMWLGRGDAENSDLQFFLEYSKKQIDEGTRKYIAEKAPLRQYVEIGLAKSGVSLAT